MEEGNGADCLIFVDFDGQRTDKNVSERYPRNYGLGEQDRVMASAYTVFPPPHLCA
jgi:hypothetical protein